MGAVSQDPRLNQYLQDPRINQFLNQLRPPEDGGVGLPNGSINPDDLSMPQLINLGGDRWGPDPRYKDPYEAIGGGRSSTPLPYNPYKLDEGVPVHTGPYGTQSGNYGTLGGLPTIRPYPFGAFFDENFRTPTTPPPALPVYADNPGAPPPGAGVPPPYNQGVPSTPDVLPDFTPPPGIPIPPNPVIAPQVPPNPSRIDLDRDFTTPLGAKKNPKPTLSFGDESFVTDIIPLEPLPPRPVATAPSAAIAPPPPPRPQVAAAPYAYHASRNSDINPWTGQNMKAERRGGGR